MADSEQVVRPDFWAVALNVTSHYEIEEKDRPFIKSINDVFMYDQNTRTHLCEATPSYYLVYLYTFVLFVEGAPDEVVGEIEQRYCYEPTENSYLHCSDVEALPMRRQYDATGTEEQSEELAREFWQSNLPF